MFPELGFQLKDDLIENVVQPFSCRKYKLCSDEPLIYKVFLPKSINEVLKCTLFIMFTIFRFSDKSGMELLG